MGQQLQDDGDGHAAQQRAALTKALERTARGDRAALQEIYQATSGKLFGTILRLLRDRAAAEDVLHDVYLKVWQRADRYNPGRASPVTWLCAIARNSAIDHLRRSNRKPYGGTDDLPEIADDAQPVDQAMCDAEDHAALRGALDELQEDHRRSIRLAYFDGLTHSQLAEKMNVPLGTTKSWIRRGLISLKGRLDV